jgi:inner membrane protein
MASVFSHAVAALGIGACFYRPGTPPRRVWITGALCSVVPDLDVIGFHFGIHYGDFWGHRGFTHSLLFAVLLATLALLLTFRQAVPGLSRFALWMYFFLATASHGFLDAMTNGGLGVAFFSPSTTSATFFRGDPSESLPSASPPFQSPWSGSRTKRTALDLAFLRAPDCLGLAHTSASCTVTRALTENCGVPAQ